MEPRLKKQIIIGSILFLFFFIAISSFSFLIFKGGPTCFDKIQNQGEEDIDCGGLCVPCEALNLQNPKVSWVKYFKFSDNMYDLGASIENLNQNYGAREIPYTFTIFFNEKEFLKKSGKTFVLPRQKKYIIEAGVKFEKEPKKIQIEFGKISWIKLENFSQLIFPIHDQSFKLLSREKGEIGFAEVNGLMVNKSPYDLEEIKILAVLYSKPLEDKLAEPIAVNIRTEHSINSKEERSFKMLWMKPFNGSVLGVDLIAEANIFLNDKFNKEFIK